MTGSDALGVYATYHAPPPNAPHFVVERNPSTANIANAQVTYTHTLGPLSDVTTYTFSSQIYTVNTNQYPQLLDVQVLDAGGNVVTTLGRYRTDSSTGSNNANYTLLPGATWSSLSWNFQPSVSATYQFRFLFSFTNRGAGGVSAGANNGVGDDFAVTAPTVMCA